jgi:hypothetical protein
MGMQYRRRIHVAICSRGHIAGEWEAMPDKREKVFCELCGGQIMARCSNCGAPTLGWSQGYALVQRSSSDFCQKCGAAYPWASRQSIVNDIENRLERDRTLSDGDRRSLRESLASLLKSPKTREVEKEQAGALRKLRDAAPKVWDAIQPTVGSVATSFIKQALNLP